MKTVNSPSSNPSTCINTYRKLVDTYMDLHVYNAALFWADKVVALSNSNPKDIYRLAQCMFLLKQYHRAAHLLRSRNLDKTNILCNCLVVRCFLEANELSEAMKVINTVNLDVITQNNTMYNTNIDALLFEDVPKNQAFSSILLLKGKVLEAMDNRILASDFYKQALHHDVHCYEAFDALIKYQMLTASEERELLNSLPVKEQCSPEEAQILLTLYESKLKKYHTPNPTTETNKRISSLPSNISNKQFRTPQPVPKLLVSTPNSVSVPDVLANNDKNLSIDKQRTKECDIEGTSIQNSELVLRLKDSLDLQVAEAERWYYNCDYQRCSTLTESILQQDPYHSDCLPIYISCQVELKQSNKLFSLAHKLVDLYPNLAISWFAVGCYYYIIGKSDYARRYLAKATCLDKLFGPAWLAYGHSFANENEHDQAMAAYFKATQLMKGCHLPLLYIGLECGLTNNVRLADKFFQQAQSIAPDDPFVMHEMGVIAFQNMDYDGAEKQFLNALGRVKRIKSGLIIPERWGPLLNNLGHTCRKLKKYNEALEYHHQALLLNPQYASTYSAIAFVHVLMGDTNEAVDWFHKALGLKRDDTFSTTMLNYVIEQLCEEKPPYPDAPDDIPHFVLEPRTANTTSIQESIVEGDSQSVVQSTGSETSDMNIEVEGIEITRRYRELINEVDMLDASGVVIE